MRKLSSLLVFLCAPIVTGEVSAQGAAGNLAGRVTVRPF